MSVRIGIHDISVATTSHVVSLTDLAAYGGIDPDKFRIGLGQDEMSVPARDDDIVTMAARAAAPIIERHGVDGIRTLYVATESGIDQSKSAAVFVHGLLGLPATCRAIELKQACYSATAAIQAALGQITRSPGERVLVIATDVARYELDSAAEATQGAAAVAMLLSADPALLEIEDVTGIHTVDVDDFWRPNDSSTAVVNGKLSVDAYIDAYLGAWDDYRARGGAAIEEIDFFCHHQPFTRMAAKGQRALAEHLGTEIADERHLPSTRYNRRIGNSYTASLYAGLAALLDGDADLTGARIGLYSYGSGSVGEFFTGRVVPGYQEATRGADVLAALDARTPLSIRDYRALHAGAALDSRRDVQIPPVSAGPFHLTGIEGRARRYRR